MNSPGIEQAQRFPVPPPSDSGLQAERTSLSWARTWAVVAAITLLVARLAAERSLAMMVIVLGALIVPVVGLVRVPTALAHRSNSVAAENYLPAFALNCGVVAIVLGLIATALALIVVP